MACISRVACLPSSLVFGRRRSATALPLYDATALLPAWTPSRFASRSPRLSGVCRRCLARRSSAARAIADAEADTPLPRRSSKSGKSNTGFAKLAPVKKQHKIVKLDVSQVKEVAINTVYAKSEGASDDAWRFVGELLVEEGADVALALKERRKEILGAAKDQHLEFKFADEVKQPLMFGFRKLRKGEDGIDSGGGGADGSGEVTVVNVRGAVEQGVPSIFRTKPSTPTPFQILRGTARAPERQTPSTGAERTARGT